MSDTLSKARATLQHAETKFPGAMASAAGVKPAGARSTATAKVAPPVKKPEPGLADELRVKQENVKQYLDTSKEPPKMHDGGVVPETGVYTLQKGETVVPNSRASEYRKVYLNRKNKTVAAKPQTRQGGGQTPVKGESHDSGSKKLPYKQAQED